MERAPVDRDLEIEIAASEDKKWRLVRRPLWSGGRWQDLRLYGPGKKKQPRYWSFAWNQERLSRSANAEELKRRKPRIYQWVIATLKNWETS
jgi:hypothetical protein